MIQKICFIIQSNYGFFFSRNDIQKRIPKMKLTPDVSGGVVLRTIQYP